MGTFHMNEPCKLFNGNLSLELLQKGFCKRDKTEKSLLRRTKKARVKDERFISIFEKKKCANPGLF